MAKYEALCSFATIDKAASKGSVIELDNVTAKDLLRAGYVKAVAEAKPAEEKKPAAKPAEPAKKKTARKKATKKEG